jgi:DNA polymerase elongation subunit (family B)
LKKKLQKTSAPDRVLRFKLQRNSLKWLLVCCFGYTGYKNARFGKIEAHEAKLEVFRANRRAIEEEARKKYLAGAIEPDGSVLIRTLDLAR